MELLWRTRGVEGRKRQAYATLRQQSTELEIARLGIEPLVGDKIVGSPVRRRREHASFFVGTPAAVDVEANQAVVDVYMPASLVGRVAPQERSGAFVHELVDADCTACCFKLREFVVCHSNSPPGRSVSPTSLTYSTRVAQVRMTADVKC